MKYLPGIFHITGWSTKYYSVCWLCVNDLSASYVSSSTHHNPAPHWQDSLSLNTAESIIQPSCTLKGGGVPTLHSPSLTMLAVNLASWAPLFSNLAFPCPLSSQLDTASTSPYTLLDGNPSLLWPSLYPNGQEVILTLYHLDGTRKLYSCTLPHTLTDSKTSSPHTFRTGEEKFILSWPSCQQASKNQKKFG